MVARLLRSADFDRVLRTRSRVSTAHFAVHHVKGAPSSVAKPPKAGVEAKLSTGVSVVTKSPVDDLPRPGAARLWLGAVVPKRHARRSVTRSLLKRQIRAVAAHHAAQLAPGLWVVRLRAPFDKTQFPSAASDELRVLARVELQGLFDRAQRLDAAV